MFKKKIGIIIYSNPDTLPPAINTIQILSNEFDFVVICRNQEKPTFIYPENVRLFRLGKLKTAKEKEAQNVILKTFEYGIFIVSVVFYTLFYRCKIIYSYDMHGFVAGFLASRLIKRIPLIYHNLDLFKLEEMKSVSYLVKYLELRLARFADKVIFPDLNRAKIFGSEARLAKLPHIVMHAPLRVDTLPSNRLKIILEKEGFNANTKVVLYQGAVNDAHSILETVQSMIFWPVDTILVIIGYVTKDFLKNIYNLAKYLNLNDRIIYLPLVSYSEIFSYTVGAYVGLALYKPKDINFIYNAGASNKLFEYLSLGIPVITNDSPYFRQVVDSSFGYFARPDSTKDIARTINSVFTNIEEYSRKSQNAKAAHLTRFNFEVQFNPIIEYIREVTNNNI